MSALKIPVTDADHVQGLKEAPLTLVEYGDYQCPYCGMAYPIVKQVQQHFERRLRFVFRNFPLTQAHPHAEAAAETAEFAGTRGRFWEMHDALYENQDQLGPALYMALVTELGLSPVALDEALRAGTYRARVRSDFTGGVRSGVNGTPAFYVNGRRHDGTFDFDALVRALDST